MKNGMVAIQAQHWDEGGGEGGEEIQGGKGKGRKKRGKKGKERERKEKRRNSVSTSLNL